MTENPLGYQIAAGYSMLGALLWRGIGFNQGMWIVYPNISVMFIGPSGVGKDTIISAVNRTIHQCKGDDYVRDRVIQGKTMEFIASKLSKLQPACAIIKAPELTALIGGKDYQKSMVQEITDLLSDTSDVIDLSTKGESRIIRDPAITMLAGSTIPWIQKAMPNGALEGGFFGRFLIVVEERPDKYVALPYYQTSIKQRNLQQQYYNEFLVKLFDILNKFNPHGFTYITPTHEAQQLYTNWYENRFNTFSSRTQDYASRSKNTVLKIAMVNAVSCGRSIIYPEDVQVGIHILNYVAQTIESVLCKAPKEVELGKEIVKVLPATTSEIIKQFMNTYPKDEIVRALGLLLDTGEVVQDKKVWRVRND